MRRAIHVLVAVVGLSANFTANAAAPDELCRVLRAFVESVGPDETREFTFRTIWGAGFKDSNDPAFAGKRCVHGDYAPGVKVCEYLMQHGSMEFSETTAEGTITCLSNGTRFAPNFDLHTGSFTVRYGGDYRGADVDITFEDDAEAGGMALKVTARGF